MRNGDCGTDAGCVYLGTTPMTGNCMPFCGFFDTSCATGTSCTRVTAVGPNNTIVLTSARLRRDTLAAGEACTSADACADGLMCYGDPSAKCSPICDSTHPCTAPATCTMLTDLVSNAVVGVCQ